jgi:hypothetical protein
MSVDSFRNNTEITKAEQIRMSDVDVDYGIRHRRVTRDQD